MKVSELKELLNNFPSDAQTAFTYETVVSPIGVDDIYISKEGVVMIGSDFRKEFESGIWSLPTEILTSQPASQPASPEL